MYRIYFKYGHCPPDFGPRKKKKKKKNNHNNNKNKFLESTATPFQWKMLKRAMWLHPTFPKLKKKKKKRKRKKEC